MNGSSLPPSFSHLTHQQAKEAIADPLSAVAVYEAVATEGEHELGRPLASLWWSGIAAGLTMSTSVVATAVFTAHLPDTSWAPLVASLGYTVGFLIVVMGQLQLFTENTLTAVLPLLAAPTSANGFRTARLWAVVLLANLIGAAAAGWLLTGTSMLDPTTATALITVSEHGTAGGPWQIFLQGIPAGFLVAGMTWLCRAAPEQRLSIIVVLTWLIAAAGFAHVIAGSVEVVILVTAGHLSLAAGLLDFVGPALLGNVVGGTGLFAMLAYAQVHQEL